MDKKEASSSLWAILIDGSAVESEQARHTLILHYQFLVEGMARKLKTRLPSWVRDDDLISYGQIGLIKAVDRYDPNEGPFRSFASAYVHGAILDELRAQDWAPRGLRRDQKLINSVLSSFENNEDEETKPTMSEVAEEMGWTEEKLAKTLKRIENSQHTHLDDYSSVDRTDTNNVDSNFSANHLCELFASTFASLPVVAQVVIAKKYFLNERMTQIVSDTHLPPAVVRQIHTDAVLEVFSTISDSVAA